MPPAYNLRIPNELRQRLADQAETEGRSLNKEIEHRLVQSFRDDEVLERLQRIEDRLA